MSRYDKSKLKLLAEEMAEHAKSLTPAPQPRVLVPDEFAPVRPCMSDRVWQIDQIRLLGRAYGFDWVIQRESRGFLGLESMPDEDLQRVARALAHAIDCRHNNIDFEDAGLMDYDHGYDDAC